MSFIKGDICSFLSLSHTWTSTTNINRAASLNQLLRAKLAAISMNYANGWFCDIVRLLLTTDSVSCGREALPLTFLTIKIFFVHKKERTKKFSGRQVSFKERNKKGVFITIDLCRGNVRERLRAMLQDFSSHTQEINCPGDILKVMKCSM